MAINFLNPEVTTGATSLLKNVSTTNSKKDIIKSSKDVSGLEIRLLPPFIKDNRTSPVWPFPGFAKLYCLTIVVSDVANQLAGAIDLKGFPRIGDNEHLPINKTIYYWQSESDKDVAPNQVHVFCSIIKSKQALRDTGKVLLEIKGSEEYKGLIGSLGKAAKNAAKLNVVSDIMVELAGIVGKYLGGVEDKPIGTVINSFTTLHGDFDTPGITPYLYYTPNCDFKLEVVVRNKVAEQSKTMTKKTNGQKTVNSRKKTAREEVEVEMEVL